MPLATTWSFAQRYRTIRRLGAGGMATVVLAQDERLGRLVAIKRLHGESTDEVARRFRREARLGAALNHPNVVAVYDIGSDDEGVVIVMEYVEGQTLREEVAGGKLPPERAIAILRGAAGALDYAHQNGVAHRDVKPANILIRTDGEVKLADLGIASAAEQSKITRPGSVLGTAAYMPPERLDGRPGGPPSDVYALAAVAFEMLSGRKAYEGNTPLEVAHKVVNEPTPDLRRSMPDAPEALAEVLKRGLAWEPDERPASAGELVAAIEAALPEAAAGAVVAPATAATPAPAPEKRAEPAAAEPATPARVLPPERIRTHRAHAARSPDPQPGPASRRRPELPLIAAVLGVVALLAIVLITAGGDDSESPSAEGDRSERVAPGAKQEESRNGSGSEEDAEPRAPADPAPPQNGATPAAGTPAGAVDDFYQRAARGDYAGAWALATPRGQAKLGSLAGFSQGQSSLESISFPKLKAKGKGKARNGTVTVDLRSEAVHTDRIDRCTGSIDVVNVDGAWKLDDFRIAGCAKTPRP